MLSKVARVALEEEEQATDKWRAQILLEQVLPWILSKANILGQKVK